MIKNSSQKGDAHVVIIISLVVALVAIIGFVFWQNFMQKKDTISNKSSTSASSTLPDMIVYDPAVEVANATDTSKLINSPSSLKTFIIDNINKYNTPNKAKSPVCVRIITINKVYKQQYAIGGVGTSGGNDCVGSAGILWELSGNSWIQIASTQNVGFECTELEVYKVPSAIAGTTCFDSATSNGSRVYNQS